MRRCVSLPRPCLGRPQPVVVGRAEAANALKHRGVDRPGHRWIARVAARAPGLRRKRGGQGEGRFRTDAGEHPEAAGLGKGRPEHLARAVEHLLRPGGGLLLEAQPPHDVRTEIVAVEEVGGTPDKIARPERGVRPPRPAASAGRLVGCAIGELVSILVEGVALSDPYGGLRAHGAVGVRVQPQEIHAQLGQLAHDGEVVIRVPPVRPLGEVVERLQPAHAEQGMPILRKFRKRERHERIGDNVPVKVEPDAKALCKPVDAVERADVVSPDD